MTRSPTPSVAFSRATRYLAQAFALASGGSVARQEHDLYDPAEMYEALRTMVAQDLAEADLEALSIATAYGSEAIAELLDGLLCAELLCMEARNLCRPGSTDSSHCVVPEHARREDDDLFALFAIPVLVDLNVAHGYEVADGLVPWASPLWGTFDAQRLCSELSIARLLDTDRCAFLPRLVPFDKMPARPSDILPLAHDAYSLLCDCVLTDSPEELRNWVEETGTRLRFSGDDSALSDHYVCGIAYHLAYIVGITGISDPNRPSLTVDACRDPLLSVDNDDERIESARQQWSQTAAPIIKAVLGEHAMDVEMVGLPIPPTPGTMRRQSIEWLEACVALAATSFLHVCPPDASLKHRLILSCHRDDAHPHNDVTLRVTFVNAGPGETFITGLEVPLRPLNLNRLRAMEERVRALVAQRMPSITVVRELRLLEGVASEQLCEICGRPLFPIDETTVRHDDLDLDGSCPLVAAV